MSSWQVFDDPENRKALVNRPALGVFPNKNWVELLRRVLLSCAPQGLSEVLYMRYYMVIFPV